MKPKDQFWFRGHE